MSKLIYLEVNAFLCLTQKFKMVTKSGEKIFFEKISPVESPASLWVKNLVKIALCGSVSEISRFLCLTQKFKMGAKICRKTIFVATRLCRYPVFQIFRCSVSEINTFLHSEIQDGRQRGRKMIFAKSRQWTPQTPLSPLSR